MKRNILFLLCLLLAAGSILGLTACNSKTDQEKTPPKDAATETQKDETGEDTPDDPDTYYDDPDTYYDAWDDLPAIKKSDAAYLLDPDFTVTPENFADCISDYFSAPAMLYFDILTSSEKRKIKDPKKVSAFGELFRDLQLTEIPLETYSACGGSNTDYHVSYSFISATGHLLLHEYEGNTYISFSRESSGTAIKNYFCLEGIGLISELDQISVSLKDVSEKPGEFELAENFG